MTMKRIELEDYQVKILTDLIDTRVEEFRTHAERLYGNDQYEDAYHQLLNVLDLLDIKNILK